MAKSTILNYNSLSPLGGEVFWCEANFVYVSGGGQGTMHDTEYSKTGQL